MASGQDHDGEASRLELQDRKILILYGSETGNSQDSAKDLEDMTERLHYKADVYEMDEVGLKALTLYPLVIFVISTTGQGQLPQNAQRLWKNLRKSSLKSTSLSGVKFTTFGLGDSSYTKFNWAARKLHKRLEQLGAAEFFPRGEADERHDDGIDGSFLPWSLSLRTFLLSTYPLPATLAPISADVHLPPKITLERVSAFGKMEEISKAQLLSSSTVLDDKAAQFSHIDATNAEQEEQKLRDERSEPSSFVPLSRLSERTAAMVIGGIDTLDKPNILKDEPTKYSLEDTHQTSKLLPPPDLLPIPRGWDATVHQNSRITPSSHWQDVRHLILDVKEKPDDRSTVLDDGRRILSEKLEYLPGDVVVIYPKNFPEDVQGLIDRMGWNDVADEPFKHYSKRDDAISIEHAPKGCHPMEHSTLRQLLINNYDITAIPKRSFFNHIRFFTQDQMHKERLTEFGDARFTDEFYDYTSRPRRSILEVLQEFSSVNIPYQWVPSIFPLIRGREYSIASGGPLAKSPDDPSVTSVELLVALVKYKTVLKKTRQGLCSRYLELLEPGTQIRISIIHHEGPPLDAKNTVRPVLAIAPGTGIAPIRSYFLERCLDPTHGRQVLFFGGRNHDADFFFERQWQHLDVEVFTAFSRDQREKIYVQDVIRREFATVCTLIEQGAIICLCGSSGKMPEAVRLALKDAIVLGGLCSDHATASAILQNTTTMWEEVW
ncbi:hypothetical protein BX600DRAFT_505233 [Xylariales sp. PMI_506]|nr:hypothetical protein BX600DRAFT_505233 [Xylariales sp. PMI_506]